MNSWRWWAVKSSLFQHPSSSLTSFIHSSLPHFLSGIKKNVTLAKKFEQKKFGHSLLTRPHFHFCSFFPSLFFFVVFPFFSHYSRSLRPFFILRFLSTLPIPSLCMILYIYSFLEPYGNSFIYFYFISLSFNWEQQQQQQQQREYMTLIFCHLYLFIFYVLKEILSLLEEERKKERKEWYISLYF